MFILYPRLPLPVAEKLWLKLAAADISSASSFSSAEHNAVQFAPTGGSQAKVEHLVEIQQLVRDCAKDNGYPHSVNDETSRNFDVKCGILLHNMMKLHPSEGSSPARDF